MSSEKQTAGIGKGTPGPGRPKGVPNKVTANVRAALEASLGPDGGLSFFKRLRVKYPEEYSRLVGKLLPLQLTGKDGDSLTIVVENLAEPRK